MDIDRLLRSRALRSTRIGGPRATFLHLSKDINELSRSTLSGDLKWMLEKQCVITMTTAVEVYFRDIFDAVFRLCKPESFRGYLREFHKVKYDIDDLILFHEKGIHPLELVSDGVNFQSVDAISSTFTKLLGKPFWPTVFSIRFRVAGKPETEVQLDGLYLDGLKNTIQLRHELIHNLDMHRNGLTMNELTDMHKAGLMVLGSDLVITSFIEANVDDEVRSKKRT